MNKATLRSRWKTPKGKIAIRAIEQGLRVGASRDELIGYIRNVPGTEEILPVLDLRGIELPNLIAAKKTDLSNCRFDYAKINWNFSGSKLTDAVFDGAEGLNVDFGGCDLRNSSFNGAKLPGAIFHSANLENANLTKLVAKAGQLKNANCKNANFTKADLRMVWMAHADICGTNFSGANLIGASLGGCHWDEQTNFFTAKMSPEGTPGALHLYAMTQGAVFESEKAEWQIGLLNTTLKVLQEQGHSHKSLIQKLQEIKPELVNNPDLLWANMIRDEFDDTTWEMFEEAVRKAASNMGLSA